MAYHLLSEPIRKYIRDKRWEQLRPIQAAAIERILTTNHNYILASRTASGKTEAAFLPILTKVNFNDPGVQVLYISPLIALINDQFYRVEELCKNLDVTVTKWHGEANKTEKNNLVKHAQGIVLITPESLEAMFINKPFNVKALFSNLKYVVIDEIHSFIGSDRGIQLKSILSRLQSVNVAPIIMVGLSATIGDYNEAKRFTGNEANTKVLLDKTAKAIIAVFRYYEATTEELPSELLMNLYEETRNNTVLIFPNSRGRVEEVAVKLKKIAARKKGHANYFSHHSSVDRDVREFVEYFAKNNNGKNFCIACTSTLELGIDIGSVDEVVQIDATHSIASLIQRVGRSGRKDGHASHLFLYATNQWALLQALACWLLYREGFIEPPPTADKSFDILLHQMLSIVKGHSGLHRTELIRQLRANAAFDKISVAEMEHLIGYLIVTDLLEDLRGELIIGIEGEKIVNSRDFYSVFKTEENFKVINAGNTIGDVPFSLQIIEGENIMLAARIWKIKHVDFTAKKIDVIPTPDGKKPIYGGGVGSSDPTIRSKMLEILYSTEQYDVLDEDCKSQLSLMRKEFESFDIKNPSEQRPLLSNEKDLTIFTFTGSRINKTLEYLLNLTGVKNYLDEKSSSFDIEMDKVEFLEAWRKISDPLSDIDTHLTALLQAAPATLDFSKWGIYLPVQQQVHLLKNKYFDFDGAKLFIETINLIQNS